MVALLKMPHMQYSDENFSEEASDNRRMFERKAAQGEVLGRRIDHTISARQNPRLTLSLRDLSMGGMAAVSDQPIDIGERVSFIFPPRGLIRGWNAIGRVLRCELAGVGYKLGIEFDPLPVAA